MSRAMRPPSRAALALAAGLAFGSSIPSLAAPPDPDPYSAYIIQAPEFQPVRLDSAAGPGRWDTWLYMPWRYRWAIGTGEAGGRFCQTYGIHGGVSDHGQGPLAWLTRWQLRFYNDHTAGKGDLHLDGNDFTRLARDPRALRPRPLDGPLLATLQGNLARTIPALRASPLRLAYALDDETSWGSFVRPLPWRVNADDAAYARWLDLYYGRRGGHSAPVPRFVTYDDVRGQLDGPLKEIDLSPLLDRMTYNDSVWANFLGALVASANRLDPSTPCGIVGAQPPSLWGGYDYAKLMKKVQFVEPYDRGSAPEIVRSLAPQTPNGLPWVLTHFHDDKLGPEQDSWFAWHGFAHGARGLIGWVEGWFENGRPRPWLDRFKPTLEELGEMQGKKLAGARRVDDGIGIYYSHPSIQVSWCLDAQPHGATWPKRNDDDRLGTSHLDRKAWETLLGDAGFGYRFLAYDEVVAHGVPADLRVLVLPACYALSDVEARRIGEFANRGGTVVADFACGLFDPHGKGRSRGALDALFGVHHDGTETAPRLLLRPALGGDRSGSGLPLPAVPRALRHPRSPSPRRLRRGRAAVVRQGLRSQPPGGPRPGGLLKPLPPALPRLPPGGESRRGRAAPLPPTDPGGRGHPLDRGSGRQPCRRPGDRGLVEERPHLRPRPPKPPDRPAASRRLGSGHDREAGAARRRARRGSARGA